MTGHGSLPRYLQDADVADAMARLADTFVAMVSQEVTGLDYSATSIGLLDDLCRGFLSASPAEADVHGLAVLMGAYLGETVVREGCGVWVRATTTATLADQQEDTAVLLPSGTASFPLTKVNKRLTVGPEHDLVQFFEVCRTGELPPGSQPR